MPKPFRTDCPHCSTQMVNFDYVSEYAHIKRVHERDISARGILVGFYKCGHCERAITVEQFISGIKMLENFTIDFIEDGRRGITVHREIIHPSPKSSNRPAHLPDDISKDFDDAEFNLMNKRWNTAAIGFRRVLDTSTKELWPNFKDKWLKARLDEALEKHLITPALHKLSITLKNMGDAAVHEEARYTESDAKDIAFFTEQFLTVCYTIPKTIADYEAKRAADN